MKNLILFLVISLFLSNHVYSQVSLETQIGGANFLGASLNSRFNIDLDKTKTHRISPSFGIGILFPYWYPSTTLINVGVSYNYKNWGIGTEVTGFAGKSIISSKATNGFVDMMVYPNLNYTWTFCSNLYFRFSAGSYFAFSRRAGSSSENPKLTFEGDVIPGAGIGFGYIFK